ncbi:molybdopterin-dependent oxidoreductase [Cupriavidus campinensis]
MSRIVDMLRNPGKPFDFNGKRGTYPDIRLAYWVGGNPFMHHQDRNQMREAWHKPDTFIVHDYQWTATARHADIVLPATTSYERNDIEQIGDYSATHVLAMRKVVAPLFEARNDFDIFAAICERLGTGVDFHETGAGGRQADGRHPPRRDPDLRRRLVRPGRPTPARLALPLWRRQQPDRGHWHVEAGAGQLRPHGHGAGREVPGPGAARGGLHCATRRLIEAVREKGRKEKAGQFDLAGFSFAFVALAEGAAYMPT